MGLHRDLVFALRMLRKNSLLLVVASLSLGLGLGLNTTIFSAVHALLFRAPNIERADDLVNLYSVKEGVRDSKPKLVCRLPRPARRPAKRRRTGRAQLGDG